MATSSLFVSCRSDIEWMGKVLDEAEETADGSPVMAPL